MARQRILFFTTTSASSIHRRSHFSPSQHRWIFSTSQLNGSWMDKIKGVITGKKEEPSQATTSPQSFTLLQFAEEMKNARKLGTFKQYLVGRSSEATFADAFEKQEAIIRYLGGFDATGENLQSSQKQEAAKQCNCTIADVENALAKFTWAKEAHKKVEQLKAEGKPMPKSLAEVQKLMGSTPLDLARSNLAKSGQISRNALCPCGSKKRYKRVVLDRTHWSIGRAPKSFFLPDADLMGICREGKEEEKRNRDNEEENKRRFDSRGFFPPFKSGIHRGWLRVGLVVC